MFSQSNFNVGLAASMNTNAASQTQPNQRCKEDRLEALAASTEAQYQTPYPSSLRLVCFS